MNRYERYRQQPKWLQNYFIGIAERRYCSLFLDGKRFAIIKRDGHSSYIDRGTGIVYVPVDYLLIRKREKLFYWNSDTKVMWTGRLLRGARKLFQEKLRLADSGLGTKVSPLSKEEVRDALEVGEVG